MSERRLQLNVKEAAEMRTLTLTLILVLLVFATNVLACAPAQEKEADHAFAQAADFINNKQWTQAIPSLQSALTICPDHVRSLKYLGKAYAATDRHEEARDTFLRLIQAAGTEATASDYMDLGKAYAKLQDYPNARQAYVNASRIEPDNCMILFNLAVMHGANKAYSRSVDAYERVIDNCSDLREKAMPKLVSACQQAAERERSMGNVTAAEDFERKRAEYGSQAGGSAGFQVITDMMRARDFAGAAAQCEGFLANNAGSGRLDKVYLNLARCRVQLSQVSGAIEAYNAYLDMHPEDGETAAEMLEIMVKEERCDAALAASESYLAKLTDESARFYVVYAYGKALECAGRYKEAKEQFRWVAQNGSGQHVFWAREEMTRQDQLEEIRQLKRQNAGY
jgi:tetratricopeptide (TPR) repeat protein